MPASCSSGPRAGEVRDRCARRPRAGDRRAPLRQRRTSQQLILRANGRRWRSARPARRWGCCRHAALRGDFARLEPGDCSCSSRTASPRRRTRRARSSVRLASSRCCAAWRDQPGRRPRGARVRGNRCVRRRGAAVRRHHDAHGAATATRVSTAARAYRVCGADQRLGRFGSSSEETGVSESPLRQCPPKRDKAVQREGERHIPSPRSNRSCVRMSSLEVTGSPTCWPSRRVTRWNVTPAPKRAYLATSSAPPEM